MPIARHERISYFAPRRSRREPRGFGFIEFRDARDADDALRSLDRSVMSGREITVGGLQQLPSFWGCSHLRACWLRALLPL
jgi:hypothetical protein